MIPQGLAAYDPNLDPEALYRAALGVQDPEHADWFDGLAHDLAVLRALPETERRLTPTLDPQRLP
jgi:hypothetical protein